jgi:hypothetical protein
VACFSDYTPNIIGNSLYINSHRQYLGYYFHNWVRLGGFRLLHCCKLLSLGSLNQLDGKVFWSCYYGIYRYFCGAMHFGRI